MNKSEERWEDATEARVLRAESATNAKKQA
jgi:hypothetical protein